MTENTTPIPDNDQTRARRENLDKIKTLTGNAYPNKFRRTNLTASAEGEDTITAVVGKFKEYEPPRAEGVRPTPEQLEAANTALREFGDVRVSGRISVPPRVMGKAAFVHLSDGKERLQIYVRRDDVQKMNHAGRELDGWELFSLLDHGDFIGVEGFLFITKTGELSVHVRSFEFLAKALLPMPDKMHGITDPEIGRRYRYVDLIAGSLKLEEREPGELNTREVFERRSKLITQMRAFLDAHGYIEVETPMLTPIASGAAARPFETKHNALGITLYARIAPELYLKRLLVGGFERVYELNRNFRNEGIGYRWNPEFTMLEFYCAYMDVNGMMDFCEEMLQMAVQKATGGLRVQFEQKDIDFDRFQRLTMKEAIAHYWPENIKKLGAESITANMFDDPIQVEAAHWFLAELERQTNELIESHRKSASQTYRQNQYSGKMLYKLYKTVDEYLESYPFNDVKAHFIEQGKDSLWSKSQKRAAQRSKEVRLSPDETARQIAEIFERLAEPHLVQPTFIYNYPKSISPLSKASPDDPTVAERFELFAAGMEIANGFSELNDPVEQFERFKDQQVQRERGDEEAMQMDTDYVRALAYGMPPAAGIGIGIDRLVMLLTNRRSIRDVILFPHMRPAAASKPEAEETTDRQTEADNEQASGQ